MKNGGYFILDLKGKGRKSMEGVTEVGIYDSIESNSKAVMISGLVIDGKEYPDFFAKPRLDGNAFVFEVDEDFDIAIRDTDVVFIRGDFNIGNVASAGADSNIIEGLDEKWANAKTISGISNNSRMYHTNSKKFKIEDGKYFVVGVEESLSGAFTPGIARFVISDNRYTYMGILGRD